MIVGRVLRMALASRVVVRVSAFRGMVAVAAVVGLLSLSGNLSSSPVALHAHRKRAPHREQQGEEQQDPDAQGLHSS